MDDFGESYNTKVVVKSHIYLTDKHLVQNKLFILLKNDFENGSLVTRQVTAVTASGIKFSPFESHHGRDQLIKAHSPVNHGRDQRSRTRFSILLRLKSIFITFVIYILLPNVF